MKFYITINGTICGAGYDALIDAQAAHTGIVAALPAGYYNEVAIIDDKGSFWVSNHSMVGRP